MFRLQHKQAAGFYPMWRNSISDCVALSAGIDATPGDASVTMPSVNLIYTIAYGEDAWNQAVLLVQSLRRAGGFTGDVHVYSDKSAEMTGATVFTNLDPLAFMKPHLAKAYFGRSMVHSGGGKHGLTKR